MANADGGELVIGIEDDGTLSGVPHAQDKLRLLPGVLKDRNDVNPALPCRSREVNTPDGKKLPHFEVIRGGKREVGSWQAAIQAAGFSHERIRRH